MWESIFELEKVNMPTVFEKLNLKNQQDIVVLNPPASFEPELASLEHISVCRALKLVDSFEFALAFAVTQDEVNCLAESLIPKAIGDAILWFAYPKGTSKKYQCDFNRDSGWEKLRAAGFDTVRQVAIDEDWSALRFRRREFIKSK